MITIITTDRRNTEISFDSSGCQYISQMRGLGATIPTTDDNDIPVKIRYQHNKSERNSLLTAIEKHNTVVAVKNATDGKTKTAGRTIVAENSVSVGDKIDGKIVSGLGRTWAPQNADFYSVNNIDPSAAYVQYAYLVN